MAEFVLAIPRTELTAQNVGTTGIYPFDLKQVADGALAWLPRKLADNKKPESVELGKLYPQILGYFQITDEEGRILTYRRKGKEEGLLGKYSIGVGGHVDLSDALESEVSFTGDAMDPSIEENIEQIILAGACRELYEELGVMIVTANFTFEEIISTYIDATSTVHVGLIRSIVVNPQTLSFSEAEFPAVQWLTKDELKALDGEVVFEPWSKEIISRF